jgi:hypothetical protein
MAMVRTMAAAAAAACIVATNVAPALAANDALRWGKSGGWDILIDPTLGNGCFIYTVYTGGIGLRLGFSPDDGEAYLMVGSKSWASIEHGKTYSIELRMDRDAPWRASATGVDFDGLPLLMATTDDPDFLIDFAKKNSLQVTYRGSVVATLSLRGTYAAISEMLNCQEQVDRYGVRKSDPFAR